MLTFKTKFSIKGRDVRLGMLNHSGFGS